MPVRRATRRRAYADPAWRRKFTRRAHAPLPALVGPHDHRLRRHRPGTRGACRSPRPRRKLGKDPVDLALDLALASDLQARFRMAVMNFDERKWPS